MNNNEKHNQLISPQGEYSGGRNDETRYETESA